MPTYIGAINRQIVEVTSVVPEICLYGQNIDTGTFISGLTRGLKVPASGRIINVPNCENTLCGLGFGLMMNGVHAIYFVKQEDFMVLGIDHFVNTFNFIRCSLDVSALGSFSIIMLVCDHGLQGPQSSFNNMGDFCSIAHVPCYTLTNSRDSGLVLGKLALSPGFRMIGVSSRLAKTEFIQCESIHAAPDGSLFRYTEGDGATIVCFNFSLHEGNVLRGKLAEKGVSASLFSANYLPSIDWAPVLKSVARTRKLVVMDDSKSAHIPAYRLLDEIYNSGLSIERILATREGTIDFGMSADRYQVAFDDIVGRVCK
jgi:pyruvate dehydrogenase E1 component beta subunit